MDVDLVMVESGETVMTLPVPEHVAQLARTIGVFVVKYGVNLNLDTLRFGIP